MAQRIQYGQYTVPKAEECVNFKVGQPAETMLPLDKIRQAATAKFAEDDPQYLQYGYISGYPVFRESLAKFLAGKYGKGACSSRQVDPESLFAVPGVTGALSLICSIYLRSGDTVVLGEPSYFLALRIMQDFGVKVVGVPVDEEGLDVDELERLLEGGLSPAALYTVPVFHNPTGYTLTHARRQKLVALARKFGFTILADEVYQLLGFPGAEQPPPPLVYYDPAFQDPTAPDAGPGVVFSIGSFSKILAPSLRVGWLQAAPGLLKRLYDCGQLDSSGGMNPISFGIVQKALDMGLQEEHLAACKAELGTRAATLAAALHEHCGDLVSFAEPQGGYFLWLTLPAGMDSTAFADFAAANHKVIVLPGSKFGSGAALGDKIRLSGSWYNAADLAIGAKRVGEALRAFAAQTAAAPGAAAAPRVPGGAQARKRIAVRGASGRLGQLIVQEGSGLPLVVGTTGDLPMAQLREYSATAPVVLVSNFSVGVPLLGRLLEATGKLPAGWHGDLVESHHTAKKDAPSGTAKTLVAAMAQAGISGAPTPEGGSGSTGSLLGGIPVHSLRQGDTVGTHTITLAGPGERVELTHVATRREVFAQGALRLAAWAAGLPPGMYVK
ncbi:unnamed protein product [Symbiodinium sp. KB8]|nr:unnamed protein product [Symbiodinium sp. KB8]